MPDSKTERLVTLIGCDLDQMDRSVARSGWNQWASVGALASCAWAAFATMGSDTIDVRSFMIQTVAGAFIATGLALAGSMLDPAPYSSKRELRFRFLSTEYSGARLPAAVQAAFASAQVWVLVHFDIQVSTPSYVLALVLAIAQVVLWIAVLAVSYVNLPSAQTPPRRTAILIIAFALLSAVFVWTGCNICRGVAGATWREQLDNTKMALLLNVIAYLTFRISRGPHQATLEVALTELRRELLTGAIEVDKAMERYLTISAGMKVDEILQRDVASVVAAVSHVESAYRELVDHARLLRAAVTEQSAPGTAAATLRAARQKLQVTQARIAAVNQAIGRLKRTARALVVSDSACADEVGIVLSGLNAQVDNWNTKSEEMGRQVIALLEDTDRALDTTGAVGP